jgi:anti-sigma regulatory factor (Ser/Thr protein kinase)
VPWSKQTLILTPQPPSVRRAREWVTDVLIGIGRPELAESARLSVSELVTNALLHADPPMRVEVRGTTAHPRIEVSDQSLQPPEPRRRPVDAGDELTWSTGGRGLNLVAAHSVAWGADIDPRGRGKVVWFEPSPEPREQPIAGAVFDLDEAIESLGGQIDDPDAMRDLTLLGFPVDLFLHLRLHFNELGRELRLLALTEPERYPIAVQFSETFLQVEHERRQVRGLDALERAAAAGLDRIDLRYVVPRSAGATMSRMSTLLEEIYRDFDDDSLLAVLPGDDLLALQRWYLGEFIAQADGSAPTPWTGPTRLERDVS